MKNILMVEDDSTIAFAVKYAVEQEGFNLDISENLENARKIVNSKEYDLILLDVMLPDGNGYEFLKQLREHDEDTPVIFLTACDEEVNIVMGLDIGGDDYITKPFSLIVLISKVNAFMRRIGNTIIENIIFCDKLKFDYVENKLTKDKEEILLSKNEGKLLKYLMENSSQTVTKEKLMEALWDIDGNFVDENTVAVNIRRLRQKVEDNPSEPEYIKNIRGVGYTFAKRCIKK